MGTAKCFLLRSTLFCVGLLGVSEAWSFWGSTQIEKCQMAVGSMPAVNPTSTQIDTCLRECDVSRLTSAHINYAALQANYNFCAQQRSGAADSVRANCVAAHQALLACSSDCSSQYESCLSQCQQLPNATEVTEYINRCNANRNGGARPPADATGDQEPVDPNGEGASEEAPVSAELDPAATGNPNPAVQPMPEIVATDSGTGALGNTNPGDINFAPNIGGSIQAQSPPIESGGYAGTASGTDDVFAGEQVGGPPADNNSGASPAGGGGGPMGNPGMPMGAGAGGAGARPSAATAANNRRGGPARNGAAEYLSRHSPFAYQTPPGGTANGGGAKGSRTVANKKGTPPRYNKKENDGRDALNRLFGEGMAPSSYRRNPYGAGSGKNCLDSVFCPVEVFYNKIERFPNHEINPDSF